MQLIRERPRYVFSVLLINPRTWKFAYLSIPTRIEQRIYHERLWSAKK